MALKTNEEQAITVVELTDRIEALLRERDEMTTRHEEEKARVANQIEGARGAMKSAKEILMKLVTAREPVKVLSVNGRAVIVRKTPAAEGESEGQSGVTIVPYVKVK